MASVTITESLFGTTADGQDVHKYTFRNKNGVEADVMTYGAYIMGVRAPDKQGKFTDVVLGYDNLKEYEEDVINNGAFVGRFANRISGAKFAIDGVTYKLTPNDGQGRMESKHSIHGGVIGWAKKVWKATKNTDSVTMTLDSPDGDEGFPGHVIVNVKFELTDDDELTLNVTATTDKPTPLTCTTHPYFNLAGHDKGPIYGHEVKLEADKYIVTTDDFIPTGEIASVGGSVYDLRSPTTMTEDLLSKVQGGGYAHTFCINGTGKRLAARVSEPESGRVLEVFTDQPGLVFYAAYFLASQLDGTKGRGGADYVKHGGICMEPQNYPDAPNQPDFPDSILRPGVEYHHLTVYKFSVDK